MTLPQDLQIILSKNDTLPYVHKRIRKPTKPRILRDFDSNKYLRIEEAKQVPYLSLAYEKAMANYDKKVEDQKQAEEIARREIRHCPYGNQHKWVG